MKLDIKQVQGVIDKLRFPFPYTAEEWRSGLFIENYHKHTDFSNNAVTDSAEQMENYAVVSKKYGAKCLFSGEHGSQGNQFPTYLLAEKYGLKYRHSAEAYWVKDRHESDRANCHIVLVAKNDEGRKDLNYILSIANEDGYYYQPRIDLELLLSVPPENMIVTTACIANEKYSDVESCWLKLLNHFKDNFFCELQYHNTNRQKEWNRRVLSFAKKYNVQIIAGLDSHYVLEENESKRKIMMEEKGIEYPEDEIGWYMDYPDTKEIIRRFEEQQVLADEEILIALMNTNVFVNECEDIVFDRKFKIPNIYPDLSYKERTKLLKKMLNAAYKKETSKSKDKVSQIIWEEKQYEESGTVDYPLVTSAIIKLAVEKYGGVITQTARGSAASFITNKLVGITTIDPVTAEIPLYKERFLTKDRVMSGQMPDCDLNLSVQKPFVDAARELLGEHGCYPLMTLSKFKEKQAWKMYARINKVDPSIANDVSKALDTYNAILNKLEEDEKEDIKVDDYIPEEYLAIYKDSIQYQGITQKCGVHACGHLILDKDIRREIGLMSAKNETTKKRVLVAAAEGKYLDEFGYVKEDFLVVDVVSLIDELYKSIGREVPTFDELKRMVKDDPETWDIYSKGITCCVNQCEKEHTIPKVKKYSPQTIAELSAFIAAIRPGFKSLIHQFLQRSNYSTGEEQIDTLLESSSHYMLYQESIMKILSYLGLPMSETYGVIKSISKKKLKGEKKENLLKQLKENWLKEFGNLDNFDKVWKVIEDAASYSFNACLSGDTRLQVYLDPSSEYLDNQTDYYPTVESRYRIHGGKALSMYEDGYIRSNKIVGIYESGIREIYRVTTANGSYVDCTMNHKFPTIQGFKKLEELSVGDLLYVRNGTASIVSSSPITGIHFLRVDMTYDIEMADPAHTVITESGLVVSNSHSYAMAGDSLYIAYFKAHYPAKFYETAITHYQIKGGGKDKDKISRLMDEARQFFGFKRGSYKFGVDCRRTHVDEETKTIYPNLSAIKGFGNSIADDLHEIYELNNGSFEDFYAVRMAFYGTKITRDVIEKLIAIDYFSDFGAPNKLLEICRLMDMFYKTKTKSWQKRIAIQKAEKEQFHYDLLMKHSQKVTAASYMDFDSESYMKDHVARMKDEYPSVGTVITNQLNILGTINYVDCKTDSSLYAVASIEPKGKVAQVKLYEIKTGKEYFLKTFMSVLQKKPLAEGNLIKVPQFEAKLKRRKPTAEEIEQRKSNKWIPIPGEYENWLINYWYCYD